MQTTKTDNEMTMVVTPKYTESRWVALDNNNKIISEGKTPKEVLASAKKIAEDCILMFIPIPDITYIF